MVAAPSKRNFRQFCVSTCSENAVIGVVIAVGESPFANSRCSSLAGAV